MKNIKFYTILLFLGSFMISGCDDFLEEDLRDRIATDNFYNSDKEAILASNGLYRILVRGQGFYGNGGVNIRFYTYGADEVGPSRNVNAVVHNYLFAEGVADERTHWSRMYEMVRNTSSVIENVENNENLSEDVRNQVLGDALFLRALAYFHLTNMWGDVPYFRTLLPLDELGSLERFPMEDIRRDMKEDLERAIDLLPASFSGGDLGRATTWAAATLKAKYHLFDEEWLDARDECDYVINNSPHRLLDNYGDVFNQDDPTDQFNDEHIFAVNFVTDGVFGDASQNTTSQFNPRLRDEPRNRNVRPGGPGTPSNVELLAAALQELDQDMTGFGFNIPLPEIADQANWDPDDLRYDATIVTEYLGFELSFPYFRKMWNLNNSSPRANHNDNYIVFRLADVYLMAAEAENELNGPGNAYQYVNKVRERAFNPAKPWSGMSQTEFREAMYDERKFELSAEGHRRMDLIRWGILIETVQNTVHRPWNNPGGNIQPHQIRMPIPQEEIILNPNLLNTDPTNNGYRQ